MLALQAVAAHCLLSRFIISCKGFLKAKTSAAGADLSLCRVGPAHAAAVLSCRHAGASQHAPGRSPEGSQQNHSTEGACMQGAQQRGRE